MYKIVYSAVAKKDILDIIDYIWNSYSWKVVLSITNTISLLKDFPEMWVKLDNGEREIVETKYKYQIRYVILWKEIYIMAIYKFKNIKWR